MFRRFFYTRLLMVDVCNKIAASLTNKGNHQLDLMAKNVNKQEACLKREKQAIKYFNRAEKWLDLATHILDQMKEES